MENNTTTDVNSTVETPTDATVNAVDNTDVTATTGPSENTVDNTVEQNQTYKFDDGDKFAKAFSKRLNKEKEKLSKEYEPFKKVVGLAAKQFGMTESEYIESILSDYADETVKMTDSDAKKDEKDILIEELLAEKREKEIAAEWERQAKALQKIDSNVSMDKITDDMLSLADEKKIPLEYVYAYEMLTSNRGDFEKAIEDKIMAKINKVNTTSGSLTSGRVETATPSINNMSAKDFAALKERVKRGEKVIL